MRRKIASTISSIILGFISWAIPKYIEVNNVITQENSNWLLVSTYIGIFIATCILIWGFWPSLRKIFSKNKNANNIISNLYTEISLACHIWKNAYIFYYPDRFAKRDGQQYLDVWEKMEKTAIHIYSEQEWLKYRPLFDQVIIDVINKLKELINLFSDSIDPQFKMQVYETCEQLRLERNVYLGTPNLIELFGDKNQAFNVRFSAIIRCLSSLDREAQKISAKNRPKD